MRKLSNMVIKGTLQWLLIQMTTQSTASADTCISPEKGGVQYPNVRLVGLCCLMTPGLSKDIRCHV